MRKHRYVLWGIERDESCSLLYLEDLGFQMHKIYLHDLAVGLAIEWSEDICTKS